MHHFSIAGQSCALYTEWGHTWSHLYDTSLFREQNGINYRSRPITSRLVDEYSCFNYVSSCHWQYELKGTLFYSQPLIFIFRHSRVQQPRV